MSSLAELHTNLRDKALFAEFSDREFEEFLALVDHASYAGGEIMLRQDERGDCMYIMVRGRAKVVHHREGHNIELAILRSGDFFGEIALIDEGARSADVIALEPCVLLKVTAAAVSALAGIYPTAAFKLLIAIGRIMVDRLRLSNHRYIDSLLFPIAGKDS